jgi:hypothetical protein
MFDMIGVYLCISSCSPRLAICLSRALDIGLQNEDESSTD